MYLLGYPKEKREFSAHLTSGRFRSQRNKTDIIKRIISKEKTDLGDFEVKSIDLMQSFLHPTGPEYQCLKSISI